MSSRQHDGTSRRSPGRALLLVAAGTVLTTAFAVVACRAEPAPDFGGPSVTGLASPSRPPVASVPVPRSPGPRVPVTDGGLPAAADEAPARLRIPSLGLDVTVDAVGIDPATGDFAVPPSVDRVGWYRFGPGAAARAGSIVIAGHVDSAAEGEGAFFRLGALDDGDRVTLTGPDGRDRRFTVIARERYRKTAVPLEKYFARTGDVRLTLITCGGPFDAATRHYRDNVVVTAVPRE
ncbi:class F sortase [Actinoplanes sp. CA-252034]|uniref:class F sortase n=1 Tax=Actinoplanes sp. CA-252034 TaxID=3239906 RepID=UPI003D966DB0